GARGALARPSLARLRLGDPETFDRLVDARSGGAGPGPPPGGPPGLSSADLMLAAGRLDEAAERYAQAVSERASASATSWSGLLLALAEAKPATRVLLRRPELLSSVYTTLRQRQVAAEPRRFARWLAGVGDG